MELLFLGDSKPLENAWSAGHENMLNWMNKGYCLTFVQLFLGNTLYLLLMN